MTQVHIVLDENIPRETLNWLLSSHPELTASHIGNIIPGAPDSRVFAWTQERQGILITYDSDFGDLRTFPLGEHFGIIYLRVWPPSVAATNEAISRAFEAYSWPEITGNLVIVDSHKIRIRKHLEAQ